MESDARPRAREGRDRGYSDPEERQRVREINRLIKEVFKGVAKRKQNTYPYFRHGAVYYLAESNFSESVAREVLLTSYEIAASKRGAGSEIEVADVKAAIASEDIQRMIKEEKEETDTPAQTDADDDELAEDS
ncbi:hypothetical protein [Streptomyces chattanoogensis]|uniref:hypothetical protein n=1 Tax=Streptomyces chattanoogensis TaxID=66876 RepID=UPI0036B19C8A